MGNKPVQDCGKYKKQTKAPVPPAIEEIACKQKPPVLPPQVNLIINQENQQEKEREYQAIK